MVLCNIGVSQNSTLATVWPIQRVGNFDTVQLNEQDPAGLWLFSINSTEPYSIKVVGKIHSLCQPFPQNKYMA